MEDTDPNKPQSPQEFLQEQLTNASTLFESSLSAASDALKKSTASAKNEADRAAGLLQTSYDHTLQGLHQLDDIIMSSMKGGIVAAMDHKAASAAGALGVAIILLPGLRRAVWRGTIGRYSTPEAMAEKSRGEISVMKTDLDSQQGDIKKLTERLTLAQEEYARGLQKLKGAAGEMRSLEKRVLKSETKAKDLLYEIRDLRTKTALQLRSDAAVVVESAKRQRNTVEKIIYKLEKHGL